MTPREIDALVAEKIFELAIHSRNWPCGLLEYYQSSTEDPAPEVFQELFPDRGPVYVVSADPLIVEPVAFFSTDPTASKRLRDKMREKGWAYQIGFLETYACEFLKLPTSKGDATADTEEMAVALAALAACGVEVPM